MNKSQSISLIIALGYIVASLVFRGKPTAEMAVIAIFVVLPLAFIWIPDAFGNYVSAVRGGYIDKPTPPFMIAAIGWLILLAIPVMWYLHLRAGMQAG
jgi:hypothetical protein